MELDHMEGLYNSSNPFVKHVHNKRLKIIKSLVGKNEERLLDCGCGEGHLLAVLEGIKYGIDLSEASERSIPYLMPSKTARRCPSPQPQSRSRSSFLPTKLFIIFSLLL